MSAVSQLEIQLVARARAVLASQGISVTEYAERTGQSFSMASKRLNGITRFTITDLAELSKVTGYRPAELIDDAFVLRPTTALAGKTNTALAGKEVA